MIRLTEMWKPFYLFVSAAMAALGQQDSTFAKVPFDEWLKGGEETRMKWSARIEQPRLSVHQRLIAAVSVMVDGSEFVMRSKPGQLVLFIEFRDADDRVYQSHSLLSFAEKPETLSMVNLDQYEFVRPGDYRIAVALYDIEAKEHSLKRLKMHVPDLSRDALAGSWSRLPAVEFLAMAEPPERWFLPEIRSRLDLPLVTAKPVRIEVIVNESPTEIASGRTGRVNRRNMGSLVPALKVLSQIDVRNGSMNISLLDLERRKVSFEQQVDGRLDWPRLRAALLDNDANTIDVHALENHEQNAQFFVSEVRKRTERTDDGARVLIVLSGPMAFSRGQDLRPIELAPEPGTKVFYIRYFPPAPNLSTLTTGRGGRYVGPPMQMPSRGPSLEDSLVGTLKPLLPKRFDVTNATEFRAALAAIMSDLSQWK